jgi:hypothetical protein
MAVYINEGHVPEDSGPPWKHLDGHCPLLVERAEAGFTAKRVRNRDRMASTATSTRRRCPVCFDDGPPLADVAPPAWLGQARAAEAAQPGAYWTYDLSWPARRAAQVGMATHLAARLTSRWRGTCAGRLTGNDSIPWLYDATRENRSHEIELHVAFYETRADALAAEGELRTVKRAAGWHVSSDR